MSWLLAMEMSTNKTEKRNAVTFVPLPLLMVFYSWFDKSAALCVCAVLQGGFNLVQLNLTKMSIQFNKKTFLFSSGVNCSKSKIRKLKIWNCVCPFFDDDQNKIEKKANLMKKTYTTNETETVNWFFYNVKFSVHGSKPQKQLTDLIKKHLQNN